MDSALHELEAGVEQFVRIDRKVMLDHAMAVLGCPAPEISVVECADGCVKVSIKLELSSVISTNGERINYSVVEGDISFNPANAEKSAIQKAINLLESNYTIKFFDFSSRASSILDSSDIGDLLCEGIRVVENIFVQWDKLAFNLNKFVDDLQMNEMSDYFGGQLTPKGAVYGVLFDYLHSIQSNLYERAKALLEDFSEIKSAKLHIDEKIEKRRLLSQILGPCRGVVLPSKMLLDLVLTFYGLDDADYTNSPDHLRMVKSKAVFEFPQLNNFQYGGKLAIKGYGYDSADAEDEAAYNSLLFIEKNFRTHLIDYNFNKLKKSRKAQNILISLVCRIIELGDSVKMIFGEFTNAIQWKVSQFSVDPVHFFSGPFAAGQIQAYHFCTNGLKELSQELSQCYGDCELDFAILEKLTWKLTASKTRLPL